MVVPDVRGGTGAEEAYLCDACDRAFNRRSLLRGAVIGGTMLAASGTGAFGPGRAFAGAADGAGAGLERAAMAEDKPFNSQLRPAASASGSTSQVQVAAAEPISGSSGSGGSSGGGVRGTRQIAAPNENSLPAPPIASRAVWQANESIRLDNRAYAPVRKLIIHHTASDNKPRNPADVVRFVQRFHTSDLGFSDSGYNYLIDHNGAIYEGRAARNYSSGEPISNEDSSGWGVVGAHAKSNNAGSCGICLIGNFDIGSPTDAAVASLVWLLAYKASRYRIDATADEEYIDVYGNHRVYPNISGHRQVGLTACPGKRLFALLPTIREEVQRRAGHWDPVTVDVPGVLRWEIGKLRSPSSAAVTPAAGSSSGSTPTTGTSGTAPGVGTKLIGVRVVSAPGLIYTAGKGRAHGSPAANGSTNVVALGNSGSGDGYWSLDQSGAVAAFGGVGHFGDASGKGVAADLTVTTSGSGYWVLMADGGIYPFGDARYASSPKKAGLGGTAQRMASRPQNDGYWVVMSDGSVRAFGSAPALGGPTGVGTAVDIAATPTGKGYWVLTDAGVVAPFGDAVDKGDLARSKVRWRKKATHLVRTSSGLGYLIVNSEGSMLAFGDAPLYAAFGGSGMTATGVAPAFA